jgi:hypothetical protein
MKKVILLVCLMPCFAYGQIVENFETGNLNTWVQSADGYWRADTSEIISGRYSLHHVFDNPDSGTDQIGIAVDSLHPSEGMVRWSFIIRHGCDPSSSNNWSVFLISDTGPSAIFSDGGTNGYALGVNLTGYDDTLRLWKIKGNAVTVVVNCRINWQSIISTTDPVKIIVERTNGGRWSVSSFLLSGDLIGTSTGTDIELFPCEWFIITYKYSSSRDRLLWFDDLRIEGVFHEDNEIPVTPVTPETGDVIISEIMADPEPVVFLPGREYLEITNRTESPFNLKNWKLTSGDQDYLFPEITINPYGIMIVCSVQDTSKFSRYGKVIGLKQFPTLNDNGKIILLYDGNGKLIHGVEYTSEWYMDELKSTGGWSLEMIDTGYPFYYNGNWISSESGNGGTPGAVNSVTRYNPDNSFSGDLIVFPEDSITISVRSPEPLFNLLRMIDSINIDGDCPVEIYLYDPLYREFCLKLINPLEMGKVYQFGTSGDIRDFAGNKLMKDKISFGMSESAGPGDILFNELLFNTWPGDPDYLELYNPSEKIIDASRLELISVSDDSGDTSQICLVSEKHKGILPGEYYAITADAEKVSQRYFSADRDNIFEIGSLPSMPDDKGHLILYSRELIKIDEVSYSEKMHSALLSGYEGIALEKINPDSKSDEAGNWHSASESSGWGTPGAPNSVYSEIPVTSDIVSLSSSRITPDGDGFEDMLVIDFTLTGNSNVVSVTIFDEAGGYVRKIADNMYAGPEASLVWDGTADDGSMVNTGIYIVFITMFDDSGKTHRWKKVCTVIRN